MAEVAQDRPARAPAARTPLAVWLAYGALLFAATSFAGSVVVARLAVGNVPPMTLSFMRWAIAFVILLALGWGPFWQARRTILRHLPILFVFGFYGIVGYTVPYYIGLQYTVAVNGAMLNAAGPTMTVLIALVVLKTPVSARQSIGIAFAVAGTLTIVLRGSLEALLGLQINSGDALLLLSFLSWAFYTVMLKWRPPEIDEMAFTVAIAGCSAVTMLPLYLFEVSQGLTFALNVDNLAIIGYAALFPSALSYICWNKAIVVLGANTTAMSQYLVPVLGVILSILILGEEVLGFQIAGIALIFAGVYLASKRG
jgi:drug/metabolite transporter (DMT)-like permease